WHLGRQRGGVGGQAVAIDLRDARVAGAAMLVAGFALPALPGHPGLACPLRTVTGVPCPLCGMTTSVEDTRHLHVGAALAANPAGVAVVLAAAVLVPWRRARGGDRLRPRPDPLHRALRLGDPVLARLPLDAVGQREADVARQARVDGRRAGLAVPRGEVAGLEDERVRLQVLLHDAAV